MMTYVAEVGRLFYLAKENLTYKQWVADVVKPSPYCETVAKQLCKIGTHPALHDQKLFPKIPSDYNSIYELCRLDVKDFRQLVRDKKVTPATSRADIKALVKLTLQQAADKPKLEVVGSKEEPKMEKPKTAFTPKMETALTGMRISKLISTVVGVVSDRSHKKADALKLVMALSDEFNLKMEKKSDK